MADLPNTNETAEKLNSEFAKDVLPVTVFVGILACVGFLGNVLVLYVFSFKYHKCNYKYFVLFLALIDLTSCLTTMPGEMVTQSFWYTYPVPEICKAKTFFNVFTVCSSALCLLLIAIDRYRKICKPSEWQMRPKMAIFLCICALIIAGIVATPIAILWGIQNYNNTNYNVNVTSCETDDKYKDTEYPLIYSSTIDVIIAIPMIVMAVLYSLIACEIRRSRQNARATSSNTTDTADENAPLISTSQRASTTPSFKTDTVEKNVQLQSPLSDQEYPQIERKTLIMFISSATFIITTILYLTLLSKIASNILDKLTDDERVVYFFFFRFYFIHHAINPFVYAFLDVHFKEALREMTCGIHN
ncbi:hypothetical protein ACJMK2_006317 [Sinanodonta woodiana]|uniref:G-protein coupled receptors family 1 profile domain-containing protein n=1 Tax=Sinanodonta woodiana TaxID=1069815 RepID=A0ABD3VVK4_SINWO